MKRTFIISILIIFYFKINLTKDFSVFDVKNKKLNNKTNNKSTKDKKIKDDSKNIEELKNRAKRIACLSLIRNSLKNQTSELKLFLQNHKKAYFSYFKKITDYCKDKITEDQASNILTNKNVTNVNESIPEYKALIFNDYIKNLKVDDDFLDKKKNKNKNKNKKKVKKKEKIMKILIIGCSCIVLLVLLYLFLMFKNKSNTLSKNNIENLKNKTKNKKSKTD